MWCSHAEIMMDRGTHEALLKGWNSGDSAPLNRTPTGPVPMKVLMVSKDDIFMVSSG